MQRWHLPSLVWPAWFGPCGLALRGLACGMAVEPCTASWTSPTRGGADLTTKKDVGVPFMASNRCITALLTPAS
eukprot:12262219-Alexandrium_andersonii.AAC.1